MAKYIILIMAIVLTASCAPSLGFRTFDTKEEECKAIRDKVIEFEDIISYYKAEQAENIYPVKWSIKNIKWRLKRLEERAVKLNCEPIPIEEQEEPFKIEHDDTPTERCIQKCLGRNESKNRTDCFEECINKL